MVMAGFLTLSAGIATMKKDAEPHLDGAGEGVTHEQLHAMFSESMYWPASQMQQYQRIQLENLVRHAKQNAPFYSKRLDCLFRPDGAIDWSRWSEVPILSRDEARNHAGAMLCEKVPPLHGSVQTTFTSGSSGVPLKITFPRIFTHVAGVAWQRFYKLHGLQPGRGLIDFKVTWPGLQAGHADHVSLTEEKNGTNLFTIRRNLSPETTLELMQQSGFKVVVDSPNNMEVIARANLRCGKPVRLEFVVGIGMSITPEQRELFFQSFGAKSISPYSSKEGSLMAFECPGVDNHYHTCSELLLLEIVDDKGEQVATGESGICVITPFFNSAQPFIRYRQGDILVRGPSRCENGITLPSISEIVGRKDAIFRFAGRDVTMFGMNNEELSSSMQADAYQFAQVGPEHVEVRYVSQIEMSSFDQDRVANEFRKVARFDVVITFHRVLHIPLNAGGKQQRFANEYTSPSGAVTGIIQTGK
jgi:phenylacetate-CoA ligase